MNEEILYIWGLFLTGIRKTLVPTSMLLVVSQILAVKAMYVAKTGNRAVICLSLAPCVLRRL